MKRLFVANWKMRMSNKGAIQYYHDNNSSMQKLSNNHAIVICPSFTALPFLTAQLEKNTVALGAQDCSAFEPGSYTGQVSARDIAELGCAYCIVGHSERRMYCSETNEIIAEKIKRLQENNITPIICIGETSAECIVETTYTTLEKQLLPIFTALNMSEKTDTPIIIAYEPVWAIGTGITPTCDYLTTVFTWLHQLTKKQLPNYTIALIYGGNVNEHTIKQLCNIQLINGFLIGGASTNFEQFKSTIEACDTIL
jgi:triosephosphate isomerase